jgi:phosphoribosylformimino-5-aminoimidazole carboxamide ribotide isomerase
MPVQLGGGIRDMKTIEGWLAKGVARVIIGTAAVRDPAGEERREKISRPRRGRLDAATARSRSRAGRDLELTALEIARRFEDAGVAAIIYTDIARDGLLKGLNSTRRSRSPSASRFR